jgi:Rad3-related DNA helicase
MAGEVNQVTEQGLAEKLTAALDELQEKKEQLEAASKIIEELALREKTARFNARVFREQIELLKPLESRYGAAKEIINEFYHRAQKTQGIRERYRALLKVTEQLVEFVDALKIARQIGRVLANESEDRKALLKPILASCTSAEEVKTKYGQITESLKKVIPITKETAPTTRRGGLYETVLPTKDTVKNGKGGTPVKETKAPDNGNLTEEDYQVAMAHRISEKMRVG